MAEDAQKYGNPYPEIVNVVGENGFYPVNVLVFVEYPENEYTNKEEYQELARFNNFTSQFNVIYFYLNHPTDKVSRQSCLFLPAFSEI